MKPHPLLILLFFALLLNTCKSVKEVQDEPREYPQLERPADVEPMDITERHPYAAEVDSILADMSLEEKVGQLFVVMAYGTFTNDRERELLRLKRLVRDHYIGGVIFSTGDVYGQAILNNKLQYLSKFPIWISQDMESGAAMRVNGTTRFSPAMGIAATGNPINAYQKGQITAREARALGVHQVYAPVLDVNNNPENPVINVRSYASDPNVVSEFAIEFMKGLESEGVMATGKHFPGHGDTDTDSHLALPVIDHDYERLQELELVPFQNAIDAGLRSVMSAHIAFPNISKNDDLPGTLDPSILNRILLEDLQFQGLVVTDGLQMQGITDHFSPGDAAVLSILAGADVILLSPDELTAIDGMIKAVESGRIDEDRIDYSVRKILKTKKERGLFRDRFANIENLSRQINTPEYQAVADRIARESVTLLRNEGNVLPIHQAAFEDILVLGVSDGDGHSSAGLLAEETGKYYPSVQFRELNGRTTESEIEEIIEKSRNVDLVLIGSFIMVRSYHPIQMPERQLRVLQQITETGTPSALLAFGNPYVVRDLPYTNVHLLAWASDDNQVRQTVPALFGASPVQGSFPGEIPGMYSVGDGLSLTQSRIRYDIPEAAGLITDSLLNVDKIMQEAINDSVFPGGVVGVMRNGVMAWHQGYGYHDYNKTRAVEPDDVYDLASVTKVMATTTSIMKLVDEGKISLDDPVAKYIEEFKNGNKRQITIRHLLLHTSGLPAFRIYVDVFTTRHEIIQAVKDEPLINGVGSRYVYSDLGFILLAEIVEQVSGERIDLFTRKELFSPLEMNYTWFNPDLVGPEIYNRIPPSEIDPVYRRGLVHRKVNDERAYYMGGIAGHAGLFSNANDIAKYAFMLLNGGNYGGRQLISQETIEYFIGERSSINHRGLGFDRKNNDARVITAGTLSSERTFGHTGFTGTSLWIDPERDIAVILLTNRTYPTRQYGTQISRIRSKIADAVIESIKE
ncbi:MAG: serine hydrolase [Balneolaceae bacterium]|nr:serine hydrolase [Balneolaceae bacterium]